MFRSNNVLFGIKERDPGYTYSTKEYDITQLILVTRGTLLFSSENLNEELTPFSFCMLSPGTSFSLSSRKEGYRGIAFELWQPEKNTDITISSVHHADNRMRLLAGWAEEEYRKARPLDTEYLLEICRLLYIAAKGICRNDNRISFSRIEEFQVSRAAGLLKAHAASSMSVSAILSGLPISYRHLSRHFKEQTGLTPKQFRLRYRIDMAKEYLERTTLEIGAIASELGFSSSQHLSRSFRDQEGTSPGSFRNNKQNK